MPPEVPGAQPSSESAVVVETPAAVPAAGAKPAVAPVVVATPPVIVTPEAVKPVLALKVPEGASAVLDEHDLKEFEAHATREGWTNDEAQAFVGQQVQAAQERHARLLAETKAHPEVGGEHLEAAQKHARAFLDRFSPPGTPDGEALRRGLTKTGASNWAPLVAAFARAGKAMSEDTPGSGLGSAAKVEKTQADVLYGEAKAS